MRLYYNWKEILARSWSLRFIALAFLFTFAEAILPFIHDVGWFRSLPGGILALVTAFICAVAFVARLIAQKGI